MADPTPSSSRLPGQNAGRPIAIGSLAKKQDDVTRQGTAKMVFKPVLPVRRKKPDEIKQEAAPTTPDAGRGRGRGRSAMRGGRGAAPPPPRQEMVASGPFAMGPAMAGTSARRVIHSNFTPIVPLGKGGAAALGAGLTKTNAPTLKKENQDRSVSIEDVEVYSDPDEGVEIVDLDDVKRMDWMAPESLVKDRHAAKKRKPSVKPEPGLDDGRLKEEKLTEQIDLANALDLSESEDEEEMEDLVDDFAFQSQDTQELDVHVERLYLFQFPSPFPTLESPQTATLATLDTMEVDVPEEKPLSQKALGKKVAFAADTKPASGASTPIAPTPKEKEKEEKTEKEKPKLDGMIGQLLIYQSGAVKIRLSNGMLYDVAAATQPTFLQHAVHLDVEKKKIAVLGEVTRRYVASPNIEALLEDLRLEDEAKANAMVIE